jgi:hypothetical protein
MSDDVLIIGGKRFIKQARWSADKGITTRTTARHRERGLPWLDWGNEIFIPEEDGDAYVAGLVKRRNVRRRTA